MVFSPIFLFDLSELNIKKLCLTAFLEKQEVMYFHLLQARSVAIVLPSVKLYLTKVPLNHNTI